MASKYTFIWKGSVEKNRAKLEENVKSDLGYVSVVSKCRSANCEGYPLRCLCYKGAANQRVIEVNHQSNDYRAHARELLTSERGLFHRSNRLPDASPSSYKQKKRLKISF